MSQTPKTDELLLSLYGKERGDAERIVNEFCRQLERAAVSGERVREACAKACEALEKKYNDIQSDPNCIVPDYVTADLKEEAIRECIQAIRALPLAAPPEGK